MGSRELMEWQAYEQVYGSLLIHERIDAGFAMLGMITAKAFSSNGARLKMRDFMPKWFQDLTAEQELMRGVESLRMLVDADG